ncbi:hypothetical protein CPB85DRAFT_750135 [Mucidula mucida]|nr:hypothetical protein CPB85DRAFT_750135 [Mucidula mucida]
MQRSAIDPALALRTRNFAVQYLFSLLVMCTISPAARSKEKMFASRIVWACFYFFIPHGTVLISRGASPYHHAQLTRRVISACQKGRRDSYQLMLAFTPPRQCAILPASVS